MTLNEARAILENRGFKLINEKAGQYVCFTMKEYWFDDYGPKSVKVEPATIGKITEYFTETVSEVKERLTPFDTFVGAFRINEGDMKTVTKYAGRELLNVNNVRAEELLHMVIDLVHQYYRGTRPVDCVVLCPFEDYNDICKKVKKTVDKDDPEFEDILKDTIEEEISQKVEFEL